MDHFSALANLIADQAPTIHIPWLQATATGTKETEALEDESKADFIGKPVESKLPSSTATESKEQKVDTHVPYEETSPQVHYFPVAIKRTIVTPKQGKSSSTNN